MRFRMRVVEAEAPVAPVGTRYPKVRMPTQMEGLEVRVGASMDSVQMIRTCISGAGVVEIAPPRVVEAREAGG